ncbi:MAG TPA: hypothetical protein VFZ12_04285 [Dehalococcoidia bacterium]|nr:hypothetical protein [Dehalococcoidia bacterium]
MASGDLWRPPPSDRSSRTLLVLVEVIAIVSLAALILGARSTSDPPPLQRSYPFVLGLEYGWCSEEFLGPVWQERTNDAALVCNCESRGRPNSVSEPVAYYGLFQIDPTVHSLDPADLLDPVYNSWIAATLQARDGWEPWPVCAEDLIAA